MKEAILIPGYLGSPDYLHMKVFEKRLRELGYSVERIDPGNLWSTGNIKNYTITNILNQVEERINFYKEQDAEEIILIGHSQGGMIAIIAGSKNPAVTKIAALCPPDGRKDSVDKWKENGVRVSKRDLPNHPNKYREFKVPYSFAQDASKYSASEAVRGLNRPLMIFIALEDTSVIPEVTEKIANNANDTYVVRQPSMGHNFRKSKEECELVMNEIEKFLA